MEVLNEEERIERRGGNHKGSARRGVLFLRYQFEYARGWSKTNFNGPARVGY